MKDLIREKEKVGPFFSPLLPVCSFLRLICCRAHSIEESLPKKIGLVTENASYFHSDAMLLPFVLRPGFILEFGLTATKGAIKFSGQEGPHPPEAPEKGVQGPR